MKKQPKQNKRHQLKKSKEGVLKKEKSNKLSRARSEFLSQFKTGYEKKKFKEFMDYKKGVKLNDGYMSLMEFLNKYVNSDKISDDIDKWKKEKNSMVINANKEIQPSEAL